MNGEYIKKIPLPELHEMLAEYLKEYQSEFYESIFSQADFLYNNKIIAELQGRMKRFEEYESLTKMFYHDISTRKDLLINPKMKIETEADALTSLSWVRSYIESADYSSLEALKSPILAAITEAGRKNGQILWPLRVALSGEEFSPGAFELAYILGKEKSLTRIDMLLSA
jgi:glutamyl/glutaminyl-tRNA synthetase